ncbi:MAG TPA: adenylate/guanylate cyclase domain-containing protein [Acidimicrobiia bacterium]|nr:adenylate/guanylate cyclase domain-containing protein [Acidimicrobiia bacterium]
MPAPTSPERPVVAERRIVSVLFVDLVGFTSLSEGRDPEDVRSLITEYFALAQGIIDRFGGTVDKFIGDAVMAWWGATASQEDDAERAVRAALEIVDRVSSLGEQVGLKLTARAGVMTGEASVGPGGNERGLLLGDLVNSASRIQSVAASGTVLTGPVTADLVRESIEIVEAGTHNVKGKEEPLTAFRAVRTLAERGGRGRADALEPPFVGRASELRLIKDLFHATGNDGRARLVSLVGQAGIGKSRLIWEFRKYLDGLVETVFWHQGRSPSYGDGIALWALGEMLRQRARIQETDDEATTQQRLAEALAAHVPDEAEQQWIGERLTGLLGAGESASQEREELFAAARAFFERLSLKGTVVLVFEDLQFADPSLLEFIEELPDWSQNHPILVITMTRPELLERRPDWGSGRRGFTSLYVGPLTDAEMAELIEGTVAGIPPGITGRMVEVAGGVPLFAVEMIRMLIGDGTISIEPEGTTVADVTELEIPTSVQAVISARLDRLPFEEREMARDASILGNSFTIDALTALRDESTDKIERRLGELVRREILEMVRDPLSPERGQFRWVQGLLREVAYGRIGRQDRHHLHLLAARYFRDLDDPELAPIAASHFVAAGQARPDPALEAEMVGTLRRAIDRARSVHAHEQVLSLVNTSLPLVPLEARIELHGIAAESAVRHQENAVADNHVEEAAAIATQLPEFAHRAVALRGYVANETRRSSSVRQILEDHLAANPEPGDDPDLARIAVYLARVYMLEGNGMLAADIAHEVLGTLERLGMLEETVDALITMGTGLVIDRTHQGMALLKGALEIARKNGLTGTTLRALINIGFGSPDTAESTEATRQAFEEARRIGDKSHGLFALANLVEAHLLNLELPDAAALLYDPVTSKPPPADSVSLDASRSRLAQLQGDRARADEYLAAARRRSSEVSDRQVVSNLAFTAHHFQIFDMEFDESIRLFRQRFNSDEPFHPWATLACFTEAAAMAGDRSALREAREMIAKLPASHWREHMEGWIGAILALLDQGSDGLELVRSQVSRFEANRLRSYAVSMMVAAARLLPHGDADRAAITADALRIANDAGAQGLKEWIDLATR